MLRAMENSEKTKFQLYLDGLTPLEKRKLAVRLDTSYANLAHLRLASFRSKRREDGTRGRMYPGIKILLKVKAATGGKIKPEDCLPKKASKNEDQ